VALSEAEIRFRSRLHAVTLPALEVLAENAGNLERRDSDIANAIRHLATAMRETDVALTKKEDSIR